MKNRLYPLKFTPILKDKIWGGQKLATKLNKKSTATNVGESWEISDVEGDVSIVENGHLKGQTLKALLDNYGSDLIGNKNYEVFGNKFPLLIKFIDAKEDLSIQLHPNDSLAKKRHNSFGKTEMWYVMQADQDAKLIVGFNQFVTQKTYLEHLRNKSLIKILNFDTVKEGDTYFIEVGRVHAIGAGVMLAEIQQTSDITYRVYDWDRLDADGKERELHNELAIDAIDFAMDENFRVGYSKIPNTSNKMVSCPYFTTNYIEVRTLLSKINDKDSFIIYMCVCGIAKVSTANFTEILNKGETLLLPAAIKNYQIASEKATLLEVYV